MNVEETGPILNLNHEGIEIGALGAAQGAGFNEQAAAELTQQFVGGRKQGGGLLGHDGNILASRSS